MEKDINVYTDEFHGFGVFRFDFEKYEWTLCHSETVSGKHDQNELVDALWYQLDRQLELDQDMRDWGC